MDETFDHERLDVYQAELEFVTWATAMIEEAKGLAGAKARQVCDHLDCASLSALLNTAEGSGRRQGRLRARFFDDARGAAVECAACLDALVAKGICPRERVVRGRELLRRVVAMLTKLVLRFGGAHSTREAEAGYVALGTAWCEFPSRANPDRDDEYEDDEEDECEDAGPC